MGKNIKPNISFYATATSHSVKLFEEIFEFLSNNTLSRAFLTDRPTPVRNIHYGDILVKYNESISVIEDEIPYIERNVLDSISSNTKLRNGDIIFADTAEDESVGRCTEIVNSGSENIVAGLHTMPCRPKEIFALGYLGFYLNSPSFHDQLRPLMQGTKVTSVSKNAISKTHLCFPNVDEQKKITLFLSKINEFISISEAELRKICNLKKAYISMLFPTNGESKPKIRFGKYTSSWINKTLGECFDERHEKSEIGELLSVTQDDGIKKFSELNRHDNSNVKSGNYKIVKKGDIAYNSMRMWQGASGYSPYNGIVSPAYTVIVPKENISSVFFSYFFKRPEIIQLFRANSQGLTSDNWNLKFPAFSQIEVVVPESFDEQEGIANIFISLDKLINTYSRELVILKHIKAACLDGMFVNE